MKEITQLISAKIKNSELYNISEVLENEAVKKSKLIPNRFTLYRSIKAKQLVAKTVGLGSKFPRYLILGKDLKEYLRNQYKK